MGYSVQWQTALLFWWGNCIFPLSTSWQRAFSLGQTNKFLYCRWENTASASVSQHVPEAKNWSLSTACWLPAARQAREEITGMYVREETKIRGFAAGSWFFGIIVLSRRLWVFAFPSSACVQVCDGLSPHLRKFCREVTTFTTGVKMEMLSGTLTLSRPETEAVKRNRGQSGDKDALWGRASEHPSSKGRHKVKIAGKFGGVGKG